MDVKKYWKTIVAVCFIIATLTIFYVMQYNTTNIYPQLHMQTKQGDEQSVENVVFIGDMFSGVMTHQTFRFEQNETKYLEQEPYTKRMRGYYQPLQIEQLQKEYRSFMRGKLEDVNLFFENETYVAYGAAPYGLWSYNNELFEIALLNKQTNEVTSFTTTIPEYGKYWYVEPYKVFMHENNVMLLTMNERFTSESEDDVAELHVYTFDIEKEELVDETTLTELARYYKDYEHQEIEMIESDKNDEEILIVQTTYNYATDVEEVETSKVVLYNMVTGSLTDVAFDAQLGIPMSFDGDYIYSFKDTKQSIDMTKYDIDKKEVTEELTLQVEPQPYMDAGAYYTVKNNDGKLYIVTSEAPFDTFVIDTTTMEVEYEGNIISTRNVNPNIGEEMYINDVEIR